MRPPNSSDPSSNTRLATALSKARDGGVPKSAIENILARVSSLESDRQHFANVTDRM